MFILKTIASCNGLDNLVAIVKFALKIIQWVVPVVLIFLGTLDLVKAVIAGKEEDIKKNQHTLIKRVIAAIIVFLVPTIVSVLMGWLGNSDWKTCWNGTKGTVGNVFNIEKLN